MRDAPPLDGRAIYRHVLLVGDTDEMTAEKQVGLDPVDVEPPEWNHREYVFDLALPGYELRGPAGRPGPLT